MPYLLIVFMVAAKLSFISTPAHLQVNQAPLTTPAASSSTSITVGDIAIWTGLPDGKTHTIAVYRGGRTNLPFVIAYGIYMDTNDVNVPLVDNGDGTWSGYVADADATVTVGWSGTLVSVSVDDGTVQTEAQYLAPCRYFE